MKLLQLPKTALAIATNSVCGTWHLPMGLDLPDVNSARWTKILHRALTNFADSKSLAWTRIRLMDVFENIASLREEKSTYSNSQTVFFDDMGRGIPDIPRSLYFGGSGNDEIRNRPFCFTEFQCYLRSLCDIVSPDLENGPLSEKLRSSLDQASSPEGTGVYLYKASGKNNFSSAWFHRLQDAYRLNIQPDYASKEAKDFVKTHFLPLVSQKIESQTLSRLDTDIAKSNMRFTLAGQSYGGTFCQMLINGLYDEMKNLSYDDNEIQTVFDNIFILNISGAAFAIPKLDRPSPKTVFIEHVFDFVGFQTNRKDIHPYYSSSINKNIKNGDGIRISQNRAFFWTQFSWKDADHPDGVIKPKRSVYGYHDLRGVLSALPDSIRQAAKISLRTKDDLPDLDNLLMLQKDKKQNIFDLDGNLSPN